MRFGSVAVALLVIAGAWPLGGCAEPERTEANPGFWGFGGDRQVRRSDEATREGGGELAEGDWAIAVASFQGPNHAAEARQAVRAYAGQTGLDDFWTIDEGVRSMVYFGTYGSPRAEAARAALRRLQQLQAGGRFTPHSLSLAPVAKVVQTDLTQWDLRTVAQQTPDAAYTLQIGMFDEMYEGDFRDAAEQRVTELRERGEDAYFYHGPNQSLVTIGVFTEAATSVPQTGPEAGQIVYHRYIREELQGRFPHAKVNGQLAPIRADGDTYVPSFLVRIPR